MLPEDKSRRSVFMVVMDMSLIAETDPQRIAVRTGQMVFAIPSDEDSVDEIVYVTDDTAPYTDEPINLGGAWAGMIDADAMLTALDRMGREALPTPPITSID
jgi:hypothetical protein